MKLEKILFREFEGETRVRRIVLEIFLFIFVITMIVFVIYFIYQIGVITSNPCLVCEADYAKTCMDFIAP